MQHRIIFIISYRYSSLKTFEINFILESETSFLKTKKKWSHSFLRLFQFSLLRAKFYSKEFREFTYLSKL